MIEGHSSKHRFHVIDLLRFLAALAVVFFHYAFRGFAADHMSPLPQLWLAPVAKYGYLGVDLFFLISGFVILLSASGGSARRFVISRVVRLYPAFWFCCSATFIAMVAANNPIFPATWKQYVVNMTMLNGFVGVPSIDASYWSLFIELKFYGLVFLLLLFRQLNNLEIYLGIWLMTTVILTLGRIPYLGAVAIPEHSAYFIAGATFFMISQNGLSAYRIAVIAASLGLAILKAVQNINELELHYNTAFNPWVISSLVTLFFVAFLLISVGYTSKFGGTHYVILGSLTYPLYLLHHNIGFLIFNTLFSRVHDYALFWGVIALMLSLAYLVNRGIEKRFSPGLKALFSKMLNATNN